MAEEKVTAAVAVAPAEELAVETPLLDQIVSEGRFSGDAAGTRRGRDLIKEFVAQVLEGHVTVTRDTETSIQARIAQMTIAAAVGGRPARSWLQQSRIVSMTPINTKGSQRTMPQSCR